MSKKKIQITLPKPCHEEWDNMLRTTNGRFCSSCQKEVIDFTHMTDTEIIRFVRNHKSDMCGSFLPSQLNRTIIVSSKSSTFNYKKIAAGVLTLLSFKVANSQSFQKPHQNMVIIPSNDLNIKEKPTTTPPVEYTISGNVSLQLQDKRELSKVIIKIGNNPKVFTTDASGHFNIILHKDEISTYTIITFEHPLLKREVRSIFKTSFPVKLAVYLEFPPSGRMGGMPIIY